MPSVEWVPPFDDETWPSSAETEEITGTLTAFVEDYSFLVLMGLIERVAAAHVDETEKRQRRAKAEGQWKPEYGGYYAAALDTARALHECAQRCVDEFDRTLEAADWRRKYVREEQTALALALMIDREKGARQAAEQRLERYGHTDDIVTGAGNGGRDTGATGRVPPHE